jgi:hypothetical protein
MSEVSVIVEVSEEVLVAISSSLLEEFKTIIVVTVAITTAAIPMIFAIEKLAAVDVDALDKPFEIEFQTSGFTGLS